MWLSAATAGPVSVEFATANVTAKRPADYAAANGTLTFTPGETSKTVTVSVAGDVFTRADRDVQAAAVPIRSAGTLGAAQGVRDDRRRRRAGDRTSPTRSRRAGCFCGRQHRGKCKGIKVKGEFGGPGNASWVFDAYNPTPGKSGKTVRLARIKRAIAGRRNRRRSRAS